MKNRPAKSQKTNLLNSAASLTTGSKVLNALFGGPGLLTGQTYELYGPEGAGKSTLLHQLVCTAFLPPSRGGLAAGSIYIDAEGTFSPRHLREHAGRFRIDPDALVRRVLKATPVTVDILLEICENQLESKAVQVGARLLCLDSIGTHFRAEYGEEVYCMQERDQKVRRVLAALQRVATRVNGVAIYTNSLAPVSQWQGSRRPWNATVLNGVQRISVWVQQDPAKSRLFQRMEGSTPSVHECQVRLGDLGFTDPPPPRARKGPLDRGIKKTIKPLS